MECSKIHELLPLYSVEGLEAKLKGEVESHLSWCKSCQLELNLLHQTIDLVSTLEPKEPPTWLWNRVYQRLPQPKEKRSILSLFLEKFILRPVPALVAAVAIFLVVFSLLFFVPKKSLYQGGRDFAPSTYIQQHNILASNEPFADRAALVTVVSLSETTGE